jgi:hypothetical protein
VRFRAFHLLLWIVALVQGFALCECRVQQLCGSGTSLSADIGLSSTDDNGLHPPAAPDPASRPCQFEMRAKAPSNSPDTTAATLHAANLTAFAVVDVPQQYIPRLSGNSRDALPTATVARCLPLLI